VIQKQKLPSTSTAKAAQEAQGKDKQRTTRQQKTTEERELGF